MLNKLVVNSAGQWLSLGRQARDSGAFLWKLIESGTPENELVNKLTEEFDVPPATAQKDLDNFIKKLTDLKILTSE